MMSTPSTILTTNDLSEVPTSTNSRLLADSFSNSRDCDDGDTSNESADENESADLALETHFQLKSRRSSSHSLINERLSVCSSPINAIKMSSRVCQIKIDEGIEPHLSREIKSERETQNTLKLKSSYDELIIDPNNDDNSSESNQHESKFKRYRASSESLNQNIPSPLSPNSYSNASSPRCFSPFHPKPSISPSPTRKVYVTRRSMSPVQLQKQLSSTSTSSSSSFISTTTTSTKRKLNDLDSESTNNNNSSKKHQKDDKFLHPLDLHSKYTFQPIKNNHKQATTSLTQSITQIATTNDFLTPIDSPCSNGYQSSLQNNSDSESCTS